MTAAQSFCAEYGQGTEPRAISHQSNHEPPRLPQNDGEMTPIRRQERAAPTGANYHARNGQAQYRPVRGIGSECRAMDRIAGGFEVSGTRVVMGGVVVECCIQAGLDAPVATLNGEHLSWWPSVNLGCACPTVRDPSRKRAETHTSQIVACQGAGGCGCVVGWAMVRPLTVPQ